MIRSLLCCFAVAAAAVAESSCPFGLASDDGLCGYPFLPSSDVLGVGTLRIQGMLEYIDVDGEGSMIRLPLGAGWGLLNRASLLAIRVDHEKCTLCGVCRKVCPVDIGIYADPDSAECVRCFRCMKCPESAVSIGLRPFRRESNGGPGAKTDILDAGTTEKADANCGGRDE